MNKLNKSNRRNAILLVFLIIIILIAVGISIGKINKRTGHVPPIDINIAHMTVGELLK